MSEGWICPVCGRGLAPWVSECPCYKKEVEIQTNFGSKELDEYLQKIKEIEKYIPPEVPPQEWWKKITVGDPPTEGGTTAPRYDQSTTGSPLPSTGHTISTNGGYYESKLL